MRRPEPRQSPCYCIQVRRAANALTKLYDQALESAGLTVCQFSLLNDIKVLGRCNKSELAQYAKIDRTTITRNLRVLLERGLVCEQPGTDRRNCRIFLTEAGGNAIAAGMQSWEETQAKIKAELGDERLREFSETLKSLEHLR